MREPGVGAADGLGYVGVEPREAFQMDFVDDRLVQLPAERLVALPVETIVHDDRLRHVRAAVGVLTLQIVAAERVGEDRRRPVDLAGDGACIWIDEQLGRVAPMALRRIPGTVNAVSIALPSSDAANVAMPAVSGLLGQIHTRLVSLVVEQAELHTLGDLREDREVGAEAVPRRSERERLART